MKALMFIFVGFVVGWVGFALLTIDYSAAHKITELEAHVERLSRRPAGIDSVYVVDTTPRYPDLPGLEERIGHLGDRLSTVEEALPPCNNWIINGGSWTCREGR